MTLTAIIAIVLAGVRLIESIYQLVNTQEAKGIISALVLIVKNFLFSIETYKKSK
jgi:hypothetical protein